MVLRLIHGHSRYNIKFLLISKFQISGQSEVQIFK